VQYRGHSGFPLRKRSYWVTTLKNTFNIEAVNYSIPDIKLIRTDTTLDLSQKAEKGMRLETIFAPTNINRSHIYSDIRLLVTVLTVFLELHTRRLKLLSAMVLPRCTCAPPTCPLHRFKECGCSRHLPNPLAEEPCSDFCSERRSLGMRSRTRFQRSRDSSSRLSFWPVPSFAQVSRTRRAAPRR